MRSRTIDIYDGDTYYYTSITVFFENMTEYFQKVAKIMSRFPSTWYYED